MARSRKKPSIWPQFLIVGIICLAAGAALAMFNPAGLRPGAAEDPSREKVTLTGPGPSAPRDPIAPAVEGLSRAALEEEVRRLEQIVTQKDAQITELTIQLKLATQ